MQYYPPISVIPNGAATIPYNQFLVSQPSCHIPQVIGEGDVTSVALPDGSIQLYFVPTPRYPPPPHYTPPCANVPWNNMEAWFIRSVPNPFPAYQPTALNPQFPKIVPPLVQNSIDCCATNPGYQLKFHNDNWTSTTDIHYFYPTLRKCSWFPKQCVAIQVDSTPPRLVEPCSQQTEPMCSKPCHCTNDRSETKGQIHEFSCFCRETIKNKKREDDFTDGQSSCNSSMSVDASKDGTKDSCHRIKHDKKKKHKARFSRDTKTGKSKNYECECNVQSAPLKTDKSITTYSEKGAGCNAEESQETQTSCGHCTPIRRVNSFLHLNDVETEFWYPRSRESKKAMESDDRWPQECDGESCASCADPWSSEESAQ